LETTTTQKKDSILFSNIVGAAQKRVPETRLGAHSIPGEVVPSAFRVRTRRRHDDALLPPDGDEDGIVQQSLCQLLSEEGHDDTKQCERKRKGGDIFGPPREECAVAAAVDENGANRHAETV